MMYRQSDHKTKTDNGESDQKLRKDDLEHATIEQKEQRAQELIQNLEEKMQGLQDRLAKQKQDTDHTDHGRFEQIKEEYKRKTAALFDTDHSVISEISQWIPESFETYGITDDQLRRVIGELSKLYTDSYKYSGKLYDFMSQKLDLFKTRCRRLRIPPLVWSEAFQVMLTGDALIELFRGIIPDTGAAGISTAGSNQAKALMRIMTDLKIDSDGQQQTVNFGAGSAQSSGILRVPTTF
ncbi:hypothetical protein E4U34_006200, partial [Claviceps purpurea]